MDPLASGSEDGLSLDDSSSQLDNVAPNTASWVTVEPVGTTNPNDTGNFFAPPSGDLIAPSFAPSPPNGFSGSQGFSVGGLLQGVAGAFGLSQSFQAQQNAIQRANQPVLQRLGLAGANGQLTQTAEIALIGGAALIVFLIMRRA